MARPISLLLFFHFILLTGTLHRNLTHAAGGRWTLLKSSIGISAMHMQLLSNDRVVIFDRTDFGRSNLSLPDGKCRNDPHDTAVKIDCSAHSAEYDVATNSIRPLMILTDTWCSSGTVAPDGRLIQTGGFNDGDRTVRIFTPCDNCDWEEKPTALGVRRWYATNQILPNGWAIIIGGRRQFNYEFYPKSNGMDRVFSLPFLQQTSDPEENNLYPFVHLNVDGNLFIFSNNRAILFNYRNNAIVRTYPKMPGGDPRCYPSTGSSVLLPLKNFKEAEVLVCGGAPIGSFNQANKGNFIKALNTCGRLKITDQSPQWTMETMPISRVMGDMVLLPNGYVLIINGASSGTAGWELGRDPATSPVIYKPDNRAGSRFEVQNPSKIPRLYHSTAILLRDGRVLIGGSNPHISYVFSGVQYPTELSLEAFSPPYLESSYSGFRPKILTPTSQTKLNYGGNLVIQFQVSLPLNPKGVSVTMVAPSFSTHSYSMNQRLIVLGSGLLAKTVSGLAYEISVSAPNAAVIAPPGNYLLFVVHGGIPSEGIWVHIQ
ncbi:aldehyde oxidase GLOX-like [Magnolia sinica]|uniref:aldehyde oxidase GLOX-like n=1 Tax=Magnolia sinica TaxID=86752 RepID=UPI0026583927|nr:aldehyde oxidase GLOX-like [Magnolia sinica]